LPTYNDLYVRDALDDNGTIPYNGATAYLSPDIIPAQAQVLTAAQLAASYGTNPTDTNINTQQINNIYLRAKNLSANSASGTISLYYTKSSLMLIPSQWVNNKIPTATGATVQNLVDVNGNTSIASNAVAVGSSAFTFNAPPVPQGFHYCMIAQVVTAAHPNAIPASFANSSAFISWVVNNPAICYRNVNIVSATLPAYQQGATFTNLDNAAEQYMFIVQGANWPANTSVNIQSTAVGFSFSYTQPFGSAPQNVSTIQTVPALFSGSVLVTLTPPAGTTVPATATVQFVFARYTTGTNDEVFLRHSRPAAHFGVQGSLATAQVVRMGECFLNLAP
jgi:hypothetical protein